MNPRHLPGALLAALVLGLAVWLVPGHAFDDDEFQHAHLAWLIGGGVVPYLEVWEHHLVVWHAVVAPVVRWLDGPSALFVLRAVGTGLLGLTMWCWWRCARQRGLDPWPTAGALALVALVPMVALKFHEVRPGTAGVALHAVASMLILCDGRRPGTWRRPLLAGLAVGGMILCSQKLVYAAVGLFAAMVLMRGWRAAGTMTAVAAGCGGLFLAVMAALGAGQATIDSVVVTNLGWERSFSPAGYANEGYRTAGPLLALALVGMATGRVDRFHLALGSILLGAVVLVAAIPVPFRQSWLPLFGPLAVFAAAAIQELSRRVSPRVLVPGVAAAAVAPVLGLVDQADAGPAEDLERMARVEAIAGTEGAVFDGRGLLFWHPHVGRHACMHQGILLMLDEAAYSAETIAALRADGLPPVIWDYRVAGMPPAITAFIREHYRPHPEDDRILVPGRRLPRSRLRGSGLAVEVPVDGSWRVTWQGGRLYCDDRPLEPGEVVDLETGIHRFRAPGFVTGVTITLVRYGD